MFAIYYAEFPILLVLYYCSNEDAGDGTGDSKRTAVGGLRQYDNDITLVNDLRIKVFPSLMVMTFDRFEGVP